MLQRWVREEVRAGAGCVPHRGLWADAQGVGEHGWWGFADEPQPGAGAGRSRAFRSPPIDERRRTRGGSPARLGPARWPTRRSPRTTSSRSGMHMRRSPAPRSTRAVARAAGGSLAPHRQRGDQRRRHRRITIGQLGGQRVGQVGGQVSGQRQRPRHRRLVAEHAGRGRCHRGYGPSQSGRTGLAPSSCDGSARTRPHHELRIRPYLSSSSLRSPRRPRFWLG
jgi:hypothetical protein